MDATHKRREAREEKFEIYAETAERRRRATARFMLRVIAAEQKHGIIRPDAVEFKARMERQANGDEAAIAAKTERAAVLLAKAMADEQVELFFDLEPGDAIELVVEAMAVAGFDPEHDDTDLLQAARHRLGRADHSRRVACRRRRGRWTAPMSAKTGKGGAGHYRWRSKTTVQLLVYDAEAAKYVSRYVPATSDNQARKALAKFVTDVAAGNVPTSKLKPTVEEAAHLWLRRKEDLGLVRESTLEAYSWAVGHIVREIGRRRVRTLTKATDIEDLATDHYQAALGASWMDTRTTGLNKTRMLSALGTMRP